MTLAERAAFLGPIRTFDPSAFRAGDGVSEQLCNLILAFGLASNDLREINLQIDVLHSHKPPGSHRINRYQGEHGGNFIFTFRLLLGVLHELGEIVKGNSSALNEEFFRKRVLGRLDTRATKAWSRVEELARGKSGRKKLDDLLRNLRNQTAFHYDGAALHEGFERQFPAECGDNRMKKPLASLGDVVGARRFFFADSAASGVIEAAATEAGVDALGAELTEVSSDISITLGLIVEAFVSERGGWSPFAEDP
jgi:hypothetical protein